MSVLAMAGVSLRRLVRDRRALFFMLVLPVVVIIVVGATVGGFNQFQVGLVDERPRARWPGGSSRARARERTARVACIPTENAMRVAMRRSEITAGVVIPADFDASLRAGRAIERPGARRAGEPDRARRAGGDRRRDRRARRHRSRPRSSRPRKPECGFDTRPDARRRRSATTAGRVTVTARDVDTKSAILPSGFSYSAPTMLVLFVFINALAFGATAIDNRRLGVYERALAAPIHARTIVHRRSRRRVRHHRAAVGADRAHRRGRVRCVVGQPLRGGGARRSCGRSSAPAPGC